jgi:predicted dehydrogenase
MVKDKVRFGVLSSAKIGVTKVIPALQNSELCEVTALASRNQDKAAKICAQLGIDTWYGSYEELLADPDIDAVYNPLPNHLHVPWSVEVLKAGKHVLCEKPLALSADEAESLVRAAASFPHLKIMEAFMYRFHPQWRKAKELVANGAVGKLKMVQSFFSYFNDDGANIRNIASMGGGGLMDIGCYCLSLSRWLYDDMPKRVCCCGEYDSSFGTDTLVSGLLEFEAGMASFTCSTLLAPYQRVNILGDAGRIEIMIPFNAPADRETVIHLYREGSKETLSFDVCDQYSVQADAFASAIRDDREVFTPLSDGVMNMRLMEQCVKSISTGGWVAVENGGK